MGSWFSSENNPKNNNTGNSNKNKISTNNPSGNVKVNNKKNTSRSNTSGNVKVNNNTTKTGGRKKNKK